MRALMPLCGLAALALPVSVFAQVVAPTAPDAPPARTATIDGRPGQGLTVTLRDPAFSLTLSSRAQVRATVTAQPGATAQTDVSIRTLRVLLGGHAFSPDLRYQVQLALAAQDYEACSASPLCDAWIHYAGPTS